MIQFQYRPLDTSKNEIRLLFPFRKSQPDIPCVPIETADKPLSRDAAIVTPDLSLNFELQTVSLDSKPVYTALSYVWGDTVDPKNISVNGSVFPVTKNLECALRHLQYTDIQPAIWIDAICLDQNSNDEKSEQVPRMGRIYSKARKILIWLGPGTKDTDQAVVILREFWLSASARYGVAMSDLFIDHNIEHVSGSLRHSRPCKVLDLLANAMEMVKADPMSRSHNLCDPPDLASCILYSILRCDWWYRVWVIQEYVLASSHQFQIGLRSIESVEIHLLAPILSCVHHTLETQEDGGFQYSRSQYRKQLRHNILSQHSQPQLPLRLDRNPYRKFVDILIVAYVDKWESRSRPICCRDVRDRIFALSGLAEEDYRSLGIETSYHKGPQEVFADVSQCLVGSGEMDILSLRRLSDCSTLEGVSQSLGADCNSLQLPSWAPDWSKRIAQPHDWFAWSRNSLFSAAGNTVARVSFRKCEGSSNLRSSTNSIILTGLLVDEVSQVGATWRRGGMNQNLFEDLDQFASQLTEIRNMSKFSQTLGHNIYTASQLHEAVWRMPIWDHESLYNLKYRRATSLSKARYDALHHWVLAEDARLEFERLCKEQPKLGLLGSLWCYIRSEKYWARYRGHIIRFQLSSERYIDRLVQWVPIVVLFLAQFAGLIVPIGNPWYEPAKGTIYYRNTMMRGHKTRSIVTIRRYIGYGPSSVQPGDIVCIFLGARVPHVLRKRGEGLPGYVLVGDAFLYGAMDGELMQDGQEYNDFEIY